MPTTKITRKQIIHNAWALFHRHGYHDTSLQMVATACDLGKAGVLHHFGSKRGLMEATLTYALDWWERYVLVLLNTGAPYETRLRTLFDRHFELASLNQSGCFFANTILETSGDDLFQDVLHGFHDRWMKAMTDFLAERFPPEEARERAYRLFADYEGSVILYKLYKDPSHLRRFADRSVASLNTPIQP